MKKSYNLNIALLRCIFCIVVLLYHTNILKGGYLAVCSFFALTGYFSVISIYKNKSIISYYIKRVKKIYLPLLIVVALSIISINLLNINKFNFKPEITSVLLGYNNYFQINANMDYFAKNINSPFIHLWYIAILMQLELVFPIIFTILKKIEAKVSKYLPFIIMFILSIISTLYFYKVYKDGNITITYYDTFARAFSYILGSTLAIYHVTIGKILPLRFKKTLLVTIFFTYLIALITLFITIPSTSKYFAISMIISTLITLRLIEYGVVLFKKNVNISNKLIKFISDISYEVYLVQYPVIYLFSLTKLPHILTIPLIIVLTLIISYIIHLAFKKRKIFLKIVFIMLTIYAGYLYITMKDNTKEINDLKDTLETNQELMKKKQEEYKKKAKEKKEKEVEQEKKKVVNEEEIMNYVTNLKVVGIGDSIMLNTVDTFYEVFPNGYFDALKNRTICAGYDVLKGIQDSGITWDVLVFNLGTNGEPNRRCKDNLRELAGGKDIFWLTTTNPDVPETNPDLIDYANEFENIHILDWPTEANNHPEYLYSDNTHLRPEATRPYVEFVKNGIYNYYLEKAKNEN